MKPVPNTWGNETPFGLYLWFAGTQRRANSPQCTSDPSTMSRSTSPALKNRSALYGTSLEHFSIACDAIPGAHFVREKCSNLVCRGIRPILLIAFVDSPQNPLTRIPRAFFRSKCSIAVKNALMFDLICNSHCRRAVQRTSAAVPGGGLGRRPKTGPGASRTGPDGQVAIGKPLTSFHIFAADVEKADSMKVIEPLRQGFPIEERPNCGSTF